MLGGTPVTGECTVPRQPPPQRRPFNPEALTYGQIAKRATSDPAFREGLQVAVVVCRSQSTACPADMAAVYLESLANGELP